MNSLFVPNETCTVIFWIELQVLWLDMEQDIVGNPVCMHCVLIIHHAVNTDVRDLQLFSLTKGGRFTK